MGDLLFKGRDQVSIIPFPKPHPLAVPRSLLTVGECLSAFVVPKPATWHVLLRASFPENVASPVQVIVMFPPAQL